LDLLRPTVADISSKARQRYQRNFNHHTREREFHPGDLVIVRDFRNAQNNIKWTSGTLLSQIGTRNWKVQVQHQTWKRHENQIQLRQWTTDDDVISIDPDKISAPHSNLQQPPQPKQPQQQLRRSSRIRKPVKRLIQEI
jgi:hypothetical protein